MFCYFGLQNGKCLKHAEIFCFEVRRDRKTPNGVIMNVVQNGYHGFLVVIDLTPKLKTSIFSKPLPLKFKTFKILKTKNMLSRYIHTTRMQHFKAISLFWAVQWPKTGKGDDVTFLKRNLWHFICRT